VNPNQIQVTPLQLLSMMSLEVQINQLQFASVQLKAQGCEDVARVLRGAADSLIVVAEKLKTEWSRAIVVAAPGDVRQLVQP